MIDGLNGLIGFPPLFFSSRSTSSFSFVFCFEQQCRLVHYRDENNDGSFSTYVVALCLPMANSLTPTIFEKDLRTLATLLHGPCCSTTTSSISCVLSTRIPFVFCRPDFAALLLVFPSERQKPPSPGASLQLDQPIPKHLPNM